jgi:hypothetical protein
MPKKSYQQVLKGPPEVRVWHTLNYRRDGSPCVLKRKFGYVKTRHENLAKAEALLKKTEEIPERQRHPAAVENLTRSVENWRNWLMFSCQTLEQHCRFAMSRFDGTLDEIRPILVKNGEIRKCGASRDPKKTADVRRLVNHLLSQLPAYIACCAVAAGTSGQNDAMKLLMQIATPVVEKVKRECRREHDLAEQLAWKYLFEKTVHKFNPASDKSNMAAFNTFFTWGARRATQKRTYNDAAPGEIKLPGKDGKFVARGTLHSQDSDDRSDMYHPGTYDEDPVTRAAVANALSGLTEDERQFAIMRFVEHTSLRKIAVESGISTHTAKSMEKVVGEKLRGLLCDFAGD